MSINDSIVISTDLAYHDGVHFLNETMSNARYNHRKDSRHQLSRPLFCSPPGILLEDLVRSTTQVRASPYLHQAHLSHRHLYRVSVLHVLNLYP